MRFAAALAIERFRLRANQQLACQFSLAAEIRRHPSFCILSCVLGLEALPIVSAASDVE